jgi:spermidine synthase
MSLLLAVAGLSAATLAYEILLMRLLSISQWHHFAYMIISLALLGYGASGTFLTLSRSWLRHQAPAVMSSAAGLFGVTVLTNVTLAHELPLNPLEFLWDTRQWLYLLGLYVLLSVPFFCAATGIGVAFTQWRDRIHWLYQGDLLGAGGGALSVVLALFLFPPSTCLRLVSLLGFIAAALVGRQWTTRQWLPILLLGGGGLLASVWPQPWLTPQPSAYKGLSQTLRLPQATVLSEQSSPLGWLTVVQSPIIPLRYAPGMSLHSPVEPPPQLGLFIDGDAMSVITHVSGAPQSLAYLDFLTAALPYHLLNHPAVLVLGAGGGMDVLLAQYHQARSIVGVELNPHVVEIVQRVHGDFAGHLYSANNVQIHVAEARSFVTHSQSRYDLIHLALLDSQSAAAAGVHALSEHYLYTVEALHLYLRHLRSGGLLAITRWLQLPPRDSLKLVATALSALERAGVEQPAQHIVLIRSWQTTTLLVKHSPFSTDEIALVRHFCAVRAFDVVYYAGMTAPEANQYNVLDTPDFFAGVMALVGPARREFQRRYKFDITPATDDRPYFFHFFKWTALPELIALHRQGGLVLLEGGYVLLIATLVQAMVVALLLILLPLLTLRRHSRALPYRWSAGGYFLALGLAFLFLEISSMQRFILFLGHPLYAIAVVLSGFLMFAGLGSGCGATLTRRFPQLTTTRLMALAVGGISSLTLLSLWLLPPLFAWASPLSPILKILLTLALLAPLAFCMGLPLPLGLAQIAAHMPELVPWVWGINGCASVVSVLLATLLAMHWGFTVVTWLAVGLYGMAAIIWGRIDRHALTPSRMRTHNRDNS